MATASTISLNIKDYGVSVVVPDDDVARIMYYLHCVTVGVGLDILQEDLVQYNRYYQLSPTRIAVVFQTAIELDPDELVGKLLFRDDEGEVVTGNSSNNFVSISAACNIVSLQRDILIAGKVQNMTNVMFFRSSWLNEFYTAPITRIARTILGTKHCIHCDGKAGICVCTACPRTSDSNCQSSFDAMVDALVSLSASSSSGRPPSPQPIPDRHHCNCDGCGWQLFTGNRYKCTSCDDYDLCLTCYNRNLHDLTHPFMQINKPGDKPIYLVARRTAPPAPNILSPPIIANPTSRSVSRSSTPAMRPEPAPYLNEPPPYAPGDGGTSPSSSSLFYNTMSTPELKTFLRERGVDFEDVLDKETLCRRAWDTHCDCMSIVELNAFLLDRNISTNECKDINSRRQKAKDAFQPPARPSQSRVWTDKSAHQFMNDDTVVLTGLKRAEMNGMTATVISVDRAAGKAQVKVEAMDKTFNVKIENLRQIQDNSPEIEELE